MLTAGAAIICSLHAKFLLHQNIPFLRYPTDRVGTFKPLTVPLQGLMTDKSNIAVSSDQCTITLVWERTTKDGYIIGLWRLINFAYTKMAPSPGSGISSTYKLEILWLWILLGFKTTLLSDCPSPYSQTVYPTLRLSITHRLLQFQLTKWLFTFSPEDGNRLAFKTILFNVCILIPDTAQKMGVILNVTNIVRTLYNLNKDSTWLCSVKEMLPNLRQRDSSLLSPQSSEPSHKKEIGMQWRLSHKYPSVHGI